MSPTKVLTINPDFFSSKQGNNSKTMKRERKQKPAESKTTNSMRKALLAKIRDYQKRDGEKISENNKQQIEEKDPSFESEFNKSLNFLQEIANKHREKKQSKNKTFKRPPIRNPNEQFVNIDLPEALIDDPQVSVAERNSSINQQTLNNTHIHQSQPINYHNVNQNTFQPINFSQPSNVSNTITRQTIDESVILKPLIKNNTVPVIQQQISIQTPTTPLIPIQTQSIVTPQIVIDTNTEMLPIQTPPLQPLQPQENIKIEIQNSHTPDLSDQVKLNIKKSLKLKNKSLTHNSHNVNRPPVINMHNMTIKTPPPYSNLKGGNKPTYREWNKTYKTHTGQPTLTIDENKNMKMSIPSKKLITRKTKTIKYNLGKKGKNINVLIKNNNTRKKIKQELMSLKRKPILEVKEYLHDKNLIKTGTLAPNDVLREIYEQSILSGDLVNENKQNLIHNFLNTKSESF